MAAARRRVRCSRSRLGYAAGLVLARIAGIDRTTGIFASVPGGAAEMSVLGERFGARVDRVAAAQSLRILIVVVDRCPRRTRSLGVHGADRYVPGTTVFSAGGFALLMAATAAGGFVAMRAEGCRTHSCSARSPSRFR